MLVKDLLPEVEWLPGKNHVNGVVPKVSFIMPSYCRDSFDLFKQAISSVLDQDLHEIELVIVDDCSPNNDARSFLLNLMNIDPRVSCLFHKQNLGVPAISSWEAILKTTGEFIAFAFDDVVFEKSGVSALYKYAQEKKSDFVHGYMNVMHRDECGKLITMTHGVRQPGVRITQQLLHTNIIPQSGIMLKRDVFFKIGMFDPHVTMVRVSDWDLWRRISEEYIIDYCKVLVATEYGPILSNSLGNIYQHSYLPALRYMLNHRNQALLPGEFQNFNLQNVFSDNSDEIDYINFCSGMLRKKHNLPILPVSGSGRRILVVGDEHEDFRKILEVFPQNIQNDFFIYNAELRPEYLLPYILNSSAVLFFGNADLFKSLQLSQVMKALGVVVYLSPGYQAIKTNSGVQYGLSLKVDDKAVSDFFFGLKNCKYDLNSRRQVAKIGFGSPIKDVRKLRYLEAFIQKHSDIKIVLPYSIEAESFFVNKEDCLSRITMISSEVLWFQTKEIWKRESIDLLVVSGDTEKSILDQAFFAVNLNVDFVVDAMAPLRFDGMSLFNWETLETLPGATAKSDRMVFFADVKKFFPGMSDSKIISEFLAGIPEVTDRVSLARLERYYVYLYRDYLENVKLRPRQIADQRPLVLLIGMAIKAYRFLRLSCLRKIIPDSWVLALKNNIKARLSS